MEKKEYHYIFQVKGLTRSNQIEIKTRGYTEGESQIYDDDFENDHEFDILGYKIKIKYLRCNLSGTFLTRSKILPLMYATFAYNKKLISGHLFNVVLSFEITDDVEKITTLPQLLSTKLNGKYKLELKTDIKTISYDIDEFPGYTNVIKKIQTLVDNPEVHELISDILQLRDDERRKKFGGLILTKPPVPRYKFSDLVERYKKGEDMQEIINTKCDGNK